MKLNSLDALDSTKRSVKFSKIIEMIPRNFLNIKLKNKELWDSYDFSREQKEYSPKGTEIPGTLIVPYYSSSSGFPYQFGALASQRLFHKFYLSLINPQLNKGIAF